MKRRALLVLGAHRSGTSALTGALIQLGVRGPRTLMPPREDNPLGFWESQVLCGFHERLLTFVGTAWNELSGIPRPPTDSPAAVRFSVELRQLLQHEFDSAALFVVKDPRMCRFVPFWLGTLDELGILGAPIVIVRHPLEVARSLSERNGFSVDRSLLLWLRHVLDAESTTRALARSLVRYQDLISDWKAVVTSISSDLDVVWPEPSALHRDDSIVRSNLRHHVVAVEPATSDPLLSSWIARTWHAVDALADPGCARDPQMLAALDEVREEFDWAVANLKSPLM